MNGERVGKGMKFPLSETMSSRDLMSRMIEHIIKNFFQC